MKKILEKVAAFTQRITAEHVIGMIILLALLLEPVIDALPVDQSHWRSISGVRYYYSEKGDQVTGWRDVDGVRYYLDPNAGGAMYTGWLELDGKRYYLDETGAMRTGWLELDGKKYLLSDDGSAMTGWCDLEDGRHYFAEDGTVHVGWLELDNGRCYLDEEGKITTGWLGFEEKQYYLDKNGYALTGWVTLKDGKHFFGQDGAVCTGWMAEGDDRRYLDKVGRPVTGWLTLDEGKYFLDENGYPVTGWLEQEDRKYYLGEDGLLATGWTLLEEHWYYLGTDGVMATGWIELDGQQHYLQEDGKAATGYVTLDWEIYCFSAKGAPILLVNRWRELPGDYTVELVSTVDDAVVAKDCEEALRQMLEDCQKAGGAPYICSSYRTMQMQEDLFWRQVQIWRDAGYRYSKAYDTAKEIVAIPGTSEHHTGYAVDITDAEYLLLDEQQADTFTQQWLMEHCWEYGFILRYPNGTTGYTGIIFEPWHYRYVGVELAQELRDLDVCLEEYLLDLTSENVY